MKGLFVKGLVLLFPFFLWMGKDQAIAQSQDFESDFQIANFPQEFLPGWYANEIRAGSSRVFQIAGQGRGGGKALAVQPIGSFNGAIWIQLAPGEFENPELEFYAKSIQNGSGSRPALVFYSWGESLEGDFFTPVQLGGDSEFANENQEFRIFSLDFPDSLKTVAEAFLKIEVRYGAGSGSAARWVMDDFKFGDFFRDELPPVVSEVKGYDASALLLRFSEKVDPVFSLFPIAYELDGVNPATVSLRQDSLVVLSFSGKLEQNKDYSIAVRQIPDMAGNFLQDTLVNFTFSDPTDLSWKALVINELMPSPRADQDLPNAEYIELLHTGDHEYRLQGLKLSNSRTTTELGELWLKPREYLILAPESQASLFEGFGQVLPVKSWPTLLNSGDAVTLQTPAGEVIDQVSYTTASWAGSEYAGGGYSLEVINPAFLCNNASQLRPSQAPARGTPGRPNSVFEPNSGMGVTIPVSTFFVDSLQVRVAFSGPIFPDFGLEDVAFSPLLEIDTLRLLTDSELIIGLMSPARAGEIYHLQLSGLRDCGGNEIAAADFTLVLPETAQPGDVIINELLFNPRTGEPKFVEIRNTSQKYLRLESWSLARLDENGELHDSRPFGEVGAILPPEGYFAITTDANALRLAYPKSSEGSFLQISTLPSYPIAGGTVALVSSAGDVLETFSYSEDLHHPLLRDPKGVSLERISPQTPASVAMNWQSASGNEGYATPGRRNSQALSGEMEEKLIQIEPEVFDPEGSSGVTFTSIRYQVTQPGWLGTFKIYSAAGQWVQTLAQNQILGTSGLLTWTGTDAGGKIVRPGYYVLVVELYDLSGRTQVIRKTLVVATRL